MRSPWPAPLFHGKPVLLDFADDISARDRRLVSVSLAGLVERIADAHAGEDAVVMAIPLQAANFHLVARLVARTPSAIEFAVSLP